jgi:hypothetical protein
MSDTRKIIDYTFDENAVGVRDALYAAIHDRVTAHIEDKKQEIARGLIAQHDEEVDMDPEDDDNEPEEGDDLEEAVAIDGVLKGDMHPHAAELLSGVKPEHRSKYKPYLKVGTYNGTDADHTAFTAAVKKAGHAVSESSPFDVLDKTKKYKSLIPDAPGRKAGFSHKRIPTGDIYSRDAKYEPATPSKRSELG